MKKILIVDDSETIRITVTAALEGAGFTVIQAIDGLDGLARLAEHEIALIILDVNMPRLGGLEMLEKVQADPKFAKIPVVMLTTEAHFTLIERAKRLGAKGWMIKPVKPENLIAAAKKIVA
ncbi:MAG TPA: response regulator [Polyangiaceae bacterium]|nr:response regulator [Polyangiaceae bacterium]